VGAPALRCCADAPAAARARHAELKKFAQKKHPQLALRKCAARVQAPDACAHAARSLPPAPDALTPRAAGRGSSSSWAGACRRANPRRAPGACAAAHTSTHASQARLVSRVLTRSHALACAAPRTCCRRRRRRRHLALRWQRGALLRVRMIA
jgi:hypothetical protein